MKRRNWKTTSCGIAAIAGNVIALAYPSQSKHGIALALFANGVGHLFAADYTPPPGSPTSRSFRAFKTLLLLAVGIGGVCLIAGSPIAALRFLPWRP